MSDIVKPKAELVPAMTAELIRATIDKPLSLLPAEWRMPVWGFWAKFASLLRSQLDLAASLREWIVTEGLTLEEAQKAFTAISRPERRGVIRYPGDVVAELAREVDYLVTQRKREEERIAAAERNKASAERADPAGVREVIRTRLRHIAGWEPEKP